MWLLCCKCNKYKALWQFNKRSDTAFGVQQYCRSCQSSHNKKYKDDNALYITNYRREYNKNHREYIKEYNRNYHFKYKDKINKRQRLYRRFNLSRDALRSSNRRSIKLIQSVKLTNSEKYRIELLYKWANILGKNFQVDHVVPLSRGGLHHPDNMHVIPRIQNLKKKDKDPKEFYGKYYNFIIKGEGHG